jgi:hypothetical protein
MKLKAYLINEGRSKKLSEEDAMDLIKTKCSKAYKKVKYEGTWIYRGAKNHDDMFYVVDPTKGVSRKSKNTANYYTLMVDNFKSWSKFPKRSKSIICSTGAIYSIGFGNLFRIFPYDNAKIGLAPGYDLWYSFPLSRKMLGIYSMSDIEDLMDNLDIEVKYLKDWKTLSDRIKKRGSELVGNKPRFLKETFYDKWLKSGDQLLDYFEKALDPKKNGFKIVKPGDELPEDHEVWIGGAPSVMVDDTWALENIIGDD